MYQVPATIGAKYNKDARHITETKSQWFAPTATDAMDMALLNTYKDFLTEQIKMWENRYSGAKKRDKKNIDYILQVQRAKLDGYLAMIEAKATGPNGEAAVSEEKPLPPEKQSKNIFLYAAAAMALLLILKR